MPFRLQLRLLHAWRHVPDDGEGWPGGGAFLKSLHGQTFSVGRSLYLLGISARFCIHAIAHGFTLWLAGLAAICQAGIINLSCQHGYHSCVFP